MSLHISQKNGLSPKMNLGREMCSGRNIFRNGETERSRPSVCSQITVKAEKVMELKNESIENAVSFAYSAHSAEAMYMVAKSISESANKGGGLITPVKVDGASVGLQLTTLKDGTEVIPAFTNTDEAKKGGATQVVICKTDSLIALAKQQQKGIVLNSWGESMYLPADMIDAIWTLIQEGRDNDVKREKKN